MAVTSIGEELTPGLIRVTKGCDSLFAIQRTNSDGDDVDWDADVYVSIDINPLAPTQVDAQVTGSMAIVRIESTIADRVRNTTTWQAIQSTPGSPSLELPVAVGVFQRQDGK